jgi:hypothetical protein
MLYFDPVSTKGIEVEVMGWFSVFDRSFNCDVTLNTNPNFFTSYRAAFV